MTPFVFLEFPWLQVRTTTRNALTVRYWDVLVEQATPIFDYCMYMYIHVAKRHYIIIHVK